MCIRDRSKKITCQGLLDPSLSIFARADPASFDPEKSHLRRFFSSTMDSSVLYLPVQRSSVAGYIAKFFSKLELEDGSGEISDHVVILQENVDIGLKIQMAKDRV